VVSLVGLQQGTLNPDAGYVCRGGYFYGGRLYKCSHAHPPLGDIVDALAISCNGYYFSEFRDAIDKYGYNNPGEGLDMFDKYAMQMGLGVTLGIDYPNESPGNLPSTAYYNKIYPKNLGSWHSPTIMSMGIGQGELQLTTLQMANLAACIANRGYWYPPHLAKQFRDGTPIPRKFYEKKLVDIEPHFFDLVQEGMKQCVARGTARVAQVPGVSVCGKTGTSQNPHGDDHSVFYAFAPKENPKIAIAVYVENAGWGASFAAPIAGLMIEKYLNDTISTERKPLEEKMAKSNLIEKFLKNKAAAKTNIAKALPTPKRDTLPDPKEVPNDLPNANTSTSAVPNVANPKKRNR
jgi:penicillin-binding protein 2